MTHEPSRQSKKTEMIEVRVSHETKRDFLAACRRTGRTASDVVRDSIEDFIRDQERPQPEAGRPLLMMIPKPVRKKRYLAAGAAVAGLAMAVALPSAAAPDPLAVFKRLDANGDGVLSVDEFSGERPTDMKQLNVRKLEKKLAQAPADPNKAVVFFLPADTDGKAVSQSREAHFQQFLAEGKVLPSEEEKRRGDFANFDKNGDGKIDLAEYQARYRMMLTNGFAKLDKDGGGTLDAQEYAGLGLQLLMTPPDVDTTLLPIAVQIGPVATAETLDANFAKLDANQDGKLTLQEYLPPA